MAIDSVSTNSTNNNAALAALNEQLGAREVHSSLGQADFLNLLTVQLQNQDPLKPMENTDFIAQMANFSSLQQMQTLTTDFTEFSSNNLLTSAQGYLGKIVTVDDPKLGKVSGMVTAIDASNDLPQIILNGVKYDISTITNVTLDPAAGNITTQSN